MSAPSSVLGKQAVIRPDQGELRAWERCKDARRKGQQSDNMSGMPRPLSGRVGGGFERSASQTMAVDAYETIEQGI